jgi:serine/threonine protein kinase
MPRATGQTVSRAERAILAALAQKDAVPGGSNALSGTEIAHAVDEASMGAVRIRPGGLYTMLSRLSDEGKALIRAAGSGSGRVGKLYQLTPAGVARLRTFAPSNTASWEAGTRVRGSYAEYVIEERLEWKYFDRSEVFRARIAKIISEAHLPTWAEIGKSVMIKSILTSLPSDSMLFAGTQTLVAYFEVVNPALKSEFDALQRLNGLPSVPWTIDFGERTVTLGAKVDARAAFIVQELVDGQPLFRHLNDLYGSHEAFRGMPASEWFDLFDKLVSGVKKAHEVGTFHRNIRPATIVIRRDDGQPVFCDVGDAVFRKADFMPLPNDEQGRPYIAPEQRGRPLVPSRRADIYALGAVMLRAATGQPPNLEGVVNDEAIKRAVSVQLLATPNHILRENLGIADIISRCLRVNLETRVATANALMQDVRLFRHPGEEPVNLSTAGELLKRLHTIQTSRGDEVFKALAAADISEIEDRLQGMTEGVAVVEGSHERIALKLSSYLSTLRRGDQYWTVSVVQFWHRKNLGVRGRYLSMNQELARRGVTIRRVFLLTPSDRTRPETHEILRAHMEAQRFLAETAPKAAHQMETRFLMVNEAQLQAVLNRGDQRGVWISGASAVELLPVYDSSGIIRLVHIRRIQRESVKPWFDKYWQKARQLDENWITHDSTSSPSFEKERRRARPSYRR